MHPFAGKQLTHEIRKFFNYRLSRAPRILQNSFGVLVSRWKIFQKSIEEKLELVKKNLLAARARHKLITPTIFRSQIK